MYGRWKCVVPAGIGAIMPTIYKLATAFITYPSEPPPQLRYYIGIAILFMFGACIAIMFEECNMKKAFFLGLSLPGIISSSGPINSQPINTSLGIIGSFNFVTNSYAGFYVSAPGGRISAPGGRISTSPGQNTTSLTKQATIHFQSELTLSQVRPIGLAIKVTTENGDVKDIGKFPVNPDAVITPLIPSNTTSISFQFGNIIAKQDVALGDKSPTIITVNLLYKPKNDFLWALGFSREMELVGIKILDSGTGNVSLPSEKNK